MDSMSEADDICVLDTGSTDDTVERLKARGAHVEQKIIAPWRFDVARNKSLKLIPKDADICCCIDLDEQFQPGWREKLERAWQPDTTRARYRYTWSFLPDGREGCVFWTDKIHKNGCYRWVNPVHEVLQYLGEGGERFVDAEGVQLDHHPDPSKSRGQYLPLLELAVREDPQNDRNRHYLGREYMFRGEWARAVSTLKAHLAMPQAVWRDERCASMRYIARCLRHLGREDEAALADTFGARFVDALAGDVCRTQAFTPEALAAVAARELNWLAQRVRKQCGLALSMGADVRDLLAAQYGKTTGMQAMRDYCETAYRALAEYVLDAEEPPADGTPAVLTAADGKLLLSVKGGEPFDLLALLPQQYRGDVDAVEAELDEIVGLAEVKNYVRDIAKNVQAQQRRKAQGLKVAEVNMHMIFTGNPGTGKTTIARILAKYLKAIGALRGGQLVEVTRADLVGRYVGHTAPLTNTVIQSALGGVLFIDEAYSLYRGGEDSFGLEAIDTLVKGIEDNRGDLVVILAGYTREMQLFLSANSGLASRFPNQIEFPDYTGEELYRITLSIAKGKGYNLDESCRDVLIQWYDEQQAADAATNGNGRMARNVLEKAILNQAKRLIADADADLALLLPGDFELD